MTSSRLGAQIGMSTPEVVTDEEDAAIAESISMSEAMYIGSMNVIDPGGPDFWNPYAEQSRAMFERWPFVTWYLKAGTVSSPGGGLWEDHTRLGFTIQTGGRAPITDPDAPLVWFGEIGGAFVGNDGTRDTVPTPGVLTSTNPITGVSTQFPLDDFFDTSLGTLRRGSLQLATGLQTTPQFGFNQGWKKLQFNTRGGLRVGHVRATYRENQSAALAALVAMQPPGNILSFTTFNDRSDTFFGLFTSLGVAVTYEDVCWGPCYFSTVSIGADIEYAYEWFDLGAFGAGDNGLGTLIPTASLNLAW